VVAADGREACLERGHQIRRGLRLLGLRLDRDLLAGGLALDQVEHAFAVLVVVPARVELGRQRRDQLLGHLQLAADAAASEIASSSSRRSEESTSSPNSIVDSISTSTPSPPARSAHSCCFERSTTRPIPTLPDSRIESSSNR